MGDKSIRLSSMLTFDENQEADIIKIVEQFTSSHRMGEFLSNLIRVAVENPEILDVKNGKYETGAIIKLMEKLGKSPTRHTYMNDINKKILDMQTKVDTIYDMCLKMYTMLEMGKRLGAHQKTENLILSEFVIEQQINNLKRVLGVDSLNTAFNSTRLVSMETKSAEILDYIISSYEPIINELKRESIQTVVSTPLIQEVVQPVNDRQLVNNEAQTVVSNEKQNTLNIKPVQLIRDEDLDQEVEFVNTNMQDLANFFSDDYT